MKPSFKAQARGYWSSATFAGSVLTGLLERVNRIEEARGVSHTVLALSQLTESPRRRGYAMLNAATLESKHGEPFKGYTLFGQAAQELEADPIASAYAAANAAEALLLAGRVRAARRSAMRAGRLAQKLRVAHLHAYSLQLQAQASHILGQREQAQITVSDAIAIFETLDMPAMLADAYAASAVLTGNRRHAGQASNCSTLCAIDIVVTLLKASFSECEQRQARTRNLGAQLEGVLHASPHFLRQSNDRDIGFRCSFHGSMRLGRHADDADIHRRYVIVANALVARPAVGCV